ncbi:major paralogous domain-containing protein [Lishizhenia tianjinensis]|uniref:Major paralogous domain-containing protein n=1 Tax=Lishizhenia tianjinensis TaxID=477690 RepID=A0A1I7BA24_9FLAO|nr:FISUMP domain-containing protein [Lishizhenia tianjinensis]SFT84045.1 major paralogous domain-containing protein [Lishizhenia tianjinensis]
MSKSLLLLIFLFSVISSCKKDEVVEKEVSITNVQLQPIDAQRVRLSYDRTVKGRVVVKEKGVIVTVDEEASLWNRKFIDSSEILTQSVAQIIRLQEANVRFYIRPYMITTEDTLFGETVHHDLGDFYGVGEGVTDADGNFYKTVVIGNQEWITENLRTLRFCNDEPLNYVQTHADVSESLPSVTNYNYDTSLVPFYGRMYDLNAIRDDRNICPCNYRVATYSDILQLIDYMGGSPAQTPYYLKEEGSIQMGNGLWFRHIPWVDNSSGLSFRPAGRAFKNDASTAVVFDELTRASVLGVLNGNNILEFVMADGYYKYSVNYGHEENFYSVRCIKVN